MNPFDYIKSINAGQDIINDSDQPALMERNYDPFLANRAFSYYNDTIMQANELNQRPSMDKLLQYDFFINSIRPRKRWSKWAKPEKSEAFELVKEYYGYNDNRAREAVSILSDDDIDLIRKKLYKGGTTK